MIPAELAPPADAGDEIPALIELLHETGQRLEELTAGEVDTVANRVGRTFVLRRAQDQLRDSEAARQAAILNALPAHIALLDAQGVIVSVNDAWRAFAGSNGMQSPGHGVGLSYLDACDGAPVEEASGAQQAAHGIRAVLSGAVASFSCEYPCHSPAESRWFLLTATPLAADRRNGAVVMHVDVTHRKHGAHALRRFVWAMDAIADAIYLVDRQAMRFLAVNDAACLTHGRTRDELLATAPWALQNSSRAELEAIYDAIIASGEPGAPVESQRLRQDGSLGWFELRRHARRSEERWTIVTLVRDITKRKEAEGRVAHLNRVYAILSGINSLMLRVGDRDELFAEACRIAVDAGGFLMAWIGIVDRDAMRMVPLASAGAGADFLAAIKDSFALAEGMPLGQSMTARAVRDKTAIVSNDSQHDRQALLGARHAESGIRSLAVLPLLIGEDAVGVVALYAGETEFFHDDELKLLRQLADDIAFAIDHLDKRERLEYLAYHDVVTGLANRRLYLDRMAQHVRGAASGAHKLAVYLLDIERFKSINDTLGQAAGDVLLRQVAAWLTANVGDAHLVARVGSDHFAVALPEVSSESEVARSLEKMLEAFRAHPFRLGGGGFRISAKVGVALYPDDGTTPDVLFKHAEAALKKAKVSGDRYLFYTQQIADAVAGKLTLENQLRQALDKGEFELHYQPKVNLESGRVTGAEALLRWNDPRTGLVLPGRFVKVLEETGLIHEVGQWALRQAIADYLRWRAAGLPALRIAVNVSVLQLRNHRFVAEIADAIGIDPRASGALELEITESMVMEDIEQNIGSLKALRAMGVRVAIDDFGTGFSSLAYLAKLPVDTLKIDRSFISDMTATQEGLALVSTIISLAHSLKLNAVAEGVETEEQSRLLRLLGCDEMQGYLFCRPVPCDVFEARFLVARDATAEPANTRHL